MDQKDGYRGILESLPDWIMQFDRDLSCIYTNGAVETCFGLARDACLGTGARDLFYSIDPAVDIHSLCQALRLCLEKGQPQQLEKGLGSQFFSLRILPQAGPQGTVETVILMGQAIGKREREYREILDNAPGVLFRCDAHAQSTLEFVGPGIEAITGYTRDDFLISKKVKYAHIIHEEDQPALFQSRAHVGRQNEYKVQYRLIHAQGHELWVEERGKGVFDAEGKLLYIIGMIEEITASREADTTLMEREESLRITLNSIGDAVIATDPEGLVQRMNPVAETLTGYTQEEARGCPLTEVFPLIKAGSRESLENPVEEVLRTGATVGLANDTILLARDGREYQIADSAAPIMNAAGEIKGVVLVFRDSTEEYRMQEEIRESEEEKRAILNGISVNIALVDRDLRILWANAAAGKSVGQDPQTMKGHPCYMFWGDGEQPCPNCPTIRAFASGRSEKAIMHTADDRIWDEGAEPLFDSCGHVKAVVEIAQDITREKEREMEVKKSAERYRSIITVSNTGAWEYHDDIGYLWCSPEYFSMLGHDPEDFSTEKGPNLEEVWLRFLHPEDGKQAEERFKQYLLAPDSMYENYFRMQHKNGHWIWIWSRGKTLPDHRGHPSSVTVGTHIDITERKETEDILRYKSYHDSLTGHYNRLSLEEEMKGLDALEQVPIGLIMADVNGLKMINDTYGHDLGDEVLRRTAEILGTVCGPQGSLFRWGGDEFVLLLPRADEKKTLRLCQSIMEFAGTAQVQGVPISLALGFASREREGTPLPEVLKEAEDALYRHKLTESRSAKHAALEALLKTLATKSYETEAHTRRMQDIAREIGEDIGLPPSELSRLDLVIVLHDIGKINISQDILTKRDALSEREWQIMKKHSEIGYRIASATPEFAHVAEDILAHHERWDGTGYPRGLQEEEIPLLARITSIADACEVMSNGRPYKTPLTTQEMMEEFKDCAGTQFDPQLVEVFLKIHERKRGT